MSHITPSGTKLASFFKHGRYVIPRFQRDYSWKKDQIQEFCDDVFDAYDQNISDYFFGPMVLVEKGPGEPLQIVDGQQRVVTVSVLAALIRDIVKENNDDSTATQIEEFLYQRKIASSKKYNTLQLNDKNNPFYEAFILPYESPLKKIGNKKPSTVSDLKIYDAYKILYDKISQKISLKDSKELGNFLQKVLDVFSVMQIIVDSEQQAYRIFATLNQRGLDLSIADLVKNYILEKSDPKEVQKNYDRWTKIAQILDNKSLDVFLKHFWMAHYGYITTQKLYGDITKKITVDSDVDSFLNDLSTDVEVYAELREPSKAFWKYDETVTNLSELYDNLKNDSTQPLFIMAVKNSMDLKDIQELSKICLNIHFRGKTIGNRTASDMVRTMVNAAELIRNKNVGLKEIKDELKKIALPDQEFINLIKESEFGGPIAKYILGKIENHRVSLHPVKTLTTAATLEHILPQKLTSDWEKNFSKEEHPKFLKRIGNLTILHSIPNRELQNKNFDEKKIKYGTETDCSITSDLAKIPIWDKNEVEKRSVAFSEDAIKIWPSI